MTVIRVHTPFPATNAFGESTCDIWYKDKRPTEAPGVDWYGLPSDVVNMLITRFNIGHYLGPAHTDLMQLGTGFTDAKTLVRLSCEEPHRIMEFTENFAAATVAAANEGGKPPRVLLEGLPNVELTRFLSAVKARHTKEATHVFYAFLTPDGDDLYTAGIALHAPSMLTKHEGCRGFLRRVFILEQPLAMGSKGTPRKLVVQEFLFGTGVQRYQPVAVEVMDEASFRRLPTLIVELPYSGPGFPALNKGLTAGSVDRLQQDLPLDNKPKGTAEWGRIALHKGQKGSQTAIGELAHALIKAGALVWLARNVDQWETMSVAISKGRRKEIREWLVRLSKATEAFQAVLPGNSRLLLAFPGPSMLNKLTPEDAQSILEAKARVVEYLSGLLHSDEVRALNGLHHGFWVSPRNQLGAAGDKRVVDPTGEERLHCLGPLGGKDKEFLLQLETRDTGLSKDVWGAQFFDITKIQVSTKEGVVHGNDGKPVYAVVLSVLQEGQVPEALQLLESGYSLTFLEGQRQHSAPLFPFKNFTTRALELPHQLTDGARAPHLRMSSAPRGPTNWLNAPPGVMTAPVIRMRIVKDHEEALAWTDLRDTDSQRGRPRVIDREDLGWQHVTFQIAGQEVTFQYGQQVALRHYELRVWAASPLFTVLGVQFQVATRELGFAHARGEGPAGGRRTTHGAVLVSLAAQPPDTTQLPVYTLSCGVVDERHTLQHICENIRERLATPLWDTILVLSKTLQGAEWHLRVDSLPWIQAFQTIGIYVPVEWSINWTWEGDSQGQQHHYFVRSLPGTFLLIPWALAQTSSLRLRCAFARQEQPTQALVFYRCAEGPGGEGGEPSEGSPLEEWAARRRSPLSGIGLTPYTTFVDAWRIADPNLSVQLQLVGRALEETVEDMHVDPRELRLSVGEAKELFDAPEGRSFLPSGLTYDQLHGLLGRFVLPRLQQQGNPVPRNLLHRDRHGDFYNRLHMASRAKAPGGAARGMPTSSGRDLPWPPGHCGA